MKLYLAAFAALAAAPAMAATPGEWTVGANPFFDFSYKIPPQAAAIPALRARLEADRAAQLAKVRRDATKDAAEAKKAGFPVRKYDYQQTWDVVTSIPDWLSLSAAYYNYSGGAHGMSWSGAMLWDRAAKVPRNPLDLFASKAALSAAIRKPFCAALDRQRAEKRGANVPQGSGDEFDKCIDPVGQTVILGSKGREKFDRIGILVAPYEAGPYVEGEYEVTLPVTPAVLAAVKPRYKQSFSVQK